MARIEAVLNDEQRANYRKLLGKPFEVTKLRFDDEPETDSDVQAVARALEADEPRIAGAADRRRSAGADPSFDVSVARPTFTSLHPRVAIDEAHDNFHTANGRYKPFADLMTNDGYFIERNIEALTLPALARHDIVVIANATCASAPRRGGASESAFTDDGMLGHPALGLGWRVAPPDPRTTSRLVRAPRRSAQRFGVTMNTSGTTDPVNTDNEVRRSGLPRAWARARPSHHAGSGPVRTDQSRQDILRPGLDWAGRKHAVPEIRGYRDLRVHRTRPNRRQAGHRASRLAMAQAGWWSWAKPPSSPPSSEDAGAWE